MTLNPEQIDRAAERLAQLNQRVQALPEALIEDYGQTGEHRTYKIRRKTFAYYVYDHHGDGRIGLWCKSSHAEQYHRVNDEPELYYVPAYLGRSGWLALRLDLAEVPWQAVDLLLRQAWLAQAPKTLAASLDSGID